EGDDTAADPEEPDCEQQGRPGRPAPDLPERSAAGAAPAGLGPQAERATAAGGVPATLLLLAGHVCDDRRPWRAMTTGPAPPSTTPPAPPATSAWPRPVPPPHSSGGCAPTRATSDPTTRTTPAPSSPEATRWRGTGAPSSAWPTGSAATLLARRPAGWRWRPCSGPGATSRPTRRPRPS